MKDVERHKTIVDDLIVIMKYFFVLTKSKKDLNE